MAKSPDNTLGEEVGGVRVDRVEGGDAPSAGWRCRLAQGVKFGGGLAGEGNAGQRIQETTVGGRLAFWGATSA